MRTRIISGAVLLALVGVVVAVGGPLLVAAILIAIAISAHEFYDMARQGGHHPWVGGGLVLALALALPAAVAALGPWVEALPGGPNPAQGWLIYLDARPAALEATTLLLAGAGLLATLLWSGLRRASPVPVVAAEGVVAPGAAPLGAAAASPGPWIDVGLTVGGALYTGGILKYGLLLNRGPGEAWWLLLIVLGTAAADSGAYFVGRALGKRKLIPHISPNKTWAGFWGGLGLCVVAVALLAGPLHIPLAHVPLLGLAIGLSSVVGDLGESLLKRSFGVKDSGTLIPGHGGLLDRLDSILLVVLVVYGYMRYFYS